MIRLARTLTIFGFAAALAGGATYALAQAGGAAAPTAPAPAGAVAAAPDVPAAVMEQGATIYANNCVACHGDAGQGGGGAVLANEPTLADGVMVVRQILYGGGFMPAFGPDLTDRRIAAVATYVRNSFGNAFGVVDPAVVIANR